MENMVNEQGIRINKYLSSMGVCSRREADRLILEKKVTIDDIPAEPGSRISGNQIVKVNGKIIGMASETEDIKRVLLAVNKPEGVICTTSEKDGGMPITKLVEYPERIYPVGRLDKDSCGLILMTNRGDLVNKIMKASTYHEKEYLVKVNKDITPEFLKGMRKGVFLKELEKTTRKCTVNYVDQRTFTIILTEGLNRQIRRMCEAFGYKVVFLQRTRIMNIELGKLNEGTWRRIKGPELQKLEKSLGL